MHLTTVLITAAITLFSLVALACALSFMSPQYGAPQGAIAPGPVQFLWEKR